MGDYVLLVLNVLLKLFELFERLTDAREKKKALNGKHVRKPR